MKDDTDELIETERILNLPLEHKIILMGHEISGLKPDGYNKLQNYHYISNQQIVKKLPELLIKYDMIILPNVLDYEEKIFDKMIRTIVKMEFTIRDSKKEIKIIFTGADQDYSGKSMGQAITECCKRFYLKLFNIAEGDGDPDSKVDSMKSVKNEMMDYKKLVTKHIASWSELDKERTRTKVIEFDYDWKLVHDAISQGRLIQTRKGIHE